MNEIQIYELLPFVKLAALIFAIPAVALGGKLITAWHDWRG